MKVIVCTFLSLLLFACSSDSNTGSGGTATVWNGTIDEQVATISVTSQTGTPRLDGGVILTFVGTSVQGSVESNFQVSGGQKVTNEEAISFGDSDINFSITVDGIRYIATSGSVTFTSYTSTVGESVQGTFDVGMVSFGTSAGHALTMTGDLNTVISAE